MPAINFEIRWPDEEIVTYYSPSTIIADFISPGTDYEVEEFAIAIETALQRASHRVKERYGYYCSAAQDELRKIKFKISQLQHAETTGVVTVLMLNRR